MTDPFGNGSGYGGDNGGGASGIDSAGDKLAKSARQITSNIGRKYRNFTSKSVGSPITLGGIFGNAPAKSSLSHTMNSNTASSNRNAGTAVGGGVAAGLLGAAGLSRANAGSSTANTTKGATTADGASPIHQPVSHPGHAIPIKRAGAVNSGHATTHPATPGTAQSTARHPKAQHATAKATAGTQHAGSHGAKAGHGARKGGSKKSKGKKK